MAVFVWNEKFSVSLETMDNQHKHFLNLLNDLDDAVQRNNGPEMVHTAIDRLFNYAMFHFRAEEKILSTCGYLDRDQQHREHSYFVNQVREMAASQQDGNLVQLGSIVSFLRDWFINHIMIEDKKYAAFTKILSPSERLCVTAD